MKLASKELGFVTFSIDYTKETVIDRDDDNMVYGTAVATVTALEPSGLINDFNLLVLIKKCNTLIKNVYL